MIVWKEEAISLLRDIKIFLQKWQSPESAEKTVEKIFENCKLLAVSPNMGKKLRRNPLARQMIFGRYRIIYRHDGNEKIYILGVFNTAFQGYEKKINNVDIP